MRAAARNFVRYIDEAIFWYGVVEHIWDGVQFLQMLFAN